MTGPQKNYIETLSRRHDIDHEQVLDMAEELTGATITDLEHLSTTQASQLIDKIKEEIGE